jgi:pimeloyl-ACP methyl ester carboxylesterase
MQAALTKTGTHIRSLMPTGSASIIWRGSGPPVVLLHGFPETNYAWRHQIRRPQRTIG